MLFNTRLGAFIASALTALNIVTNSVTMPINQQLNYLSDPLDVLYTYDDVVLTDYFNNSTIKIGEDVVTIDGVDYRDVWLSHDAANKFRVNAFDLVSARGLVDDSSGLLVSGLGFLDGTPMYGSSWSGSRSQDFLIPGVGTYSIGSSSLVVSSGTGTGGPYIRTLLSPSVGDGASLTLYNRSFPIRFFYTISGDTPSINFTDSAGLSGSQPFVNYRIQSRSPFDFNWVSRTIPAEDDFSADDGLHLYVPIDDPSSPDFNDWVDDHPEFQQPGGIEIDPSINPDIDVDLNDLVDLIIPLIPIIKAEFGPIEVAPVPPVPGETISNTDYSILNQTLQDIREDIQTIPSAIQEIISSIPTKLDSIIQSIGNLGNTILQEIEEGPIRLARKALDAIKSIFLPILVSLKNALGIWHYVVEWFTAISGPFTWFRGVMASSSPSLLVPIYAAIAGFIVIAVYRRFGR